MKNNPDFAKKTIDRIKKHPGFYRDVGLLFFNPRDVDRHLSGFFLNIYPKEGSPLLDALMREVKFSCGIKKYFYYRDKLNIFSYFSIFSVYSFVFYKFCSSRFFQPTCKFFNFFRSTSSKFFLVLAYFCLNKLSFILEENLSFLLSRFCFFWCFGRKLSGVLAAPSVSFLRECLDTSPSCTDQQEVYRSAAKFLLNNPPVNVDDASRSASSNFCI